VRSTEGGPPRGQLGAAGTPPIPLRSLARWLWLAGILLLIVYLVSIDEGAVSRTGLLLHELMHDGRHLLAVPCH
jgi:hypothetical protein